MVVGLMPLGKAPLRNMSLLETLRRLEVLCATYGLSDRVLLQDSNV